MVGSGNSTKTRYVGIRRNELPELRERERGRDEALVIERERERARESEQFAEWQAEDEVAVRCLLLLPLELTHVDSHLLIMTSATT